MDSRSSTKLLTPEAEELARDLLRDNREELAKADAKAGILLATVSVVVGVLLAGIIAGNWSPAKLSSWSQFFWWAGTASALLGLALLILAVAPRAVASRRRNTKACYFGDVAACSSERELAALLMEQCESESDRTLDQILATARITRVKYSLILWALGALAVGASATIVAVLMG